MAQQIVCDDCFFFKLVFGFFRDTTSVTVFLPAEGVESTLTVTLKLQNGHYTLLEISDGDVNTIIESAGAAVVATHRRGGVKASIRESLNALISPGFTDARVVPRRPLPV